MLNVVDVSVIFYLIFSFQMTWVTLSDRIASSIAILLTTVAIFYPFMILFLICKNTSKLEDAAYKKKCGALYEEIKTSSKSALTYNVLFVLRRLIIAAMCIFLEQYVFLQIQIMIISSLLTLTYLFRVRPFEQPLQNRLEVFNELCVLVSSYHLFAYTDFVPETMTQFKVGWSMIGVALFSVGGNVIVVVWTTIIELRKKYKRYKTIWFCCKKKPQTIERDETEK